MILQCENLTKNFGSKVSLKNLNLTIKRGEVFGLLGHNGAGKSTLIKLITGLLWPSEGRVFIDGYNVHTEHTEALAKVGAIIEYPNFILDLSARRNLTIFSGGYGKKFDEKLKDIARLTHIENYINKKVRSFSTGMKQRLGIALALLPNSEFIILDEPTNGLDPSGIVEMREIIRDFNRHLGVTILISSHLLGEIEQICNRVGIIRQGELICCGEISALLAAHTKENIRVVCDNIEQAKSILSNHSLEYTLQDEVFFMSGDREKIAHINKILVESQLKIYEIAPFKHTLESLFLEQFKN